MDSFIDFLNEGERNMAIFRLNNPKLISQAEKNQNEVFEEQISYKDKIFEYSTFLRLETELENGYYFRMDEVQVWILKINHKLIFDAVNEQLNYLRVTPIKNSRRLWRNKQSQTLCLQQLNSILDIVREKLLYCNSFLCGMIEDKEDSFMNLINNLEPGVLQQIKTDRFEKFLNFEIQKLEISFQDQKNCKEALWDLVAEEIFNDIVDGTARDLVKFN